MLMGWAWTGATCESISGCNATDIYGVDWSGSLHSSYTSCLKDCHPTTRLYEPDPGQAGVKNSIRVGGVPQGEVVRLVKSKTLGSSTVTGCNGATMNLENPKVVGQGVANAKGNVKFKRKVSANLSGKYLYYQAINVDTCEVSNLVSHYYY
jgi:hypothetical protein